RTGGDPINITPLPHPPFFAGSDRAPLWTEDGQYVYLLIRDGVWRLSIADRTATRIVNIPEYELLDFALPVDARRLITTDKNSYIVIARNRKSKKVAFWSVDIRTSQVKMLAQVDQAIGGAPYPRYSLDLTLDGKTLVYRAQDDAHAAELWVSHTAV